MANVNMRGDDIYDSQGSLIGYLRGNDFYDSHGSRIGYLQGNDIYDSHGSRIGTLDDVRKSIEGGYGGVSLAAIWILFVR